MLPRSIRLPDVFRCMALIAGIAAVSLTANNAYSQSVYPQKPIRLVVPYAAGGGIDAIARLVAQDLSDGLGQAVAVDNRAGAGGMIGAEFVARSQPDGYTVLFAGNPELTINPTLMGGTRYNVGKDFIPLMLVSESPNVLVAHPSLRAGLHDIVEGTDRGDGTLSVGTPGLGTPQHLTVEVLKSLSKAQWVHVPYKGAAPAIVDVLGGQTRLVLTGAPPLLPHIKSGKLKALAVMQPRRSSLMPDIPTFEEASGLKVLESYSTWYGVLVPAGTPAQVTGPLQKALATTLARPEIRQKLQELGTEVVALPGPQFGERIRLEILRYGDVIRRFNLKAE